VGDATERAYRRSDALMKRRELMMVWADFLGTARTTPWSCPSSESGVDDDAFLS
jgi:hypothetical protein